MVQAGCAARGWAGVLRSAYGGRGDRVVGLNKE